MIDCEIPSRAAHTAHDFIGNQENALPAADFGHTLQIAGRRYHCAECGSADRFDNEGCNLSRRRLDRLLQFCGILLPAIAASIGAVKGASVAIGKFDVSELPYHRKIHLAPTLVS